MTTEAPDTDQAAIARLNGAKPPDDPARPSYRLTARCEYHQTRSGSTSGGSTAAARFEISSPDAASLIAAGVIGTQAFDVQFGGKTRIGDGWTIKQVVVRNNAADGGSDAHLDLVAPQSATREASLLSAKDLVGKSGELVLGPSQVTMEELLGPKAGE